ncbi:N-acetylmuramoyl-L-alanine amidase [Bacillus rhizoplanae]|uniref:N-acetylmuramoyl-L-alanine amidase n=1 Tax=Bacillus rhizoplanae TaxID=2880966 RepID=UPI003D24929A
MMKPITGQPASGIATVTNPNGATIYSSPSEQASILEIVSSGIYLPFLRKYPDKNGNWYEVTLLDGNKGWLLGSEAIIQATPSNIASLPLSDLSAAIITIDPGHGGSASGAISADGTYEEKNANLDIALKLENILRSENNIQNIWMTRTDDRDVSLAYRADLGTASGGHLFISIHNNSNSASSHGTETYYQCGKEQALETQQKSKLLAGQVQGYLLTSIGNSGCVQPNNRGVKCRLWGKNDYYYVLRNTFIPAVIAECVFISNPIEGACLENENFRLILARGIHDGIVAYLTS